MSEYERDFSFFFFFFFFFSSLICSFLTFMCGFGFYILMDDFVQYSIFSF